jgi:hypothetical protein
VKAVAISSFVDTLGVAAAGSRRELRSQLSDDGAKKRFFTEVRVTPIKKNGDFR